MKFLMFQYNTLIFDFDGVVLNSNQVKTEAFFYTTLPYGEDAANAMVEYHIKHGGILRYKKIAYLLDYIVPAKAIHGCGSQLDVLLHRYAAQVYQGLLT
ncbi:hypothetical protein [Vreelandella azerica]|uniref:hypothetical protein n=1 Tax=Vreelandella azerica TaxID=2732867 RepID=UPI001C1215C8|nr:hypothetical protein [Halomonas azerica]